MNRLLPFLLFTALLATSCSLLKKTPPPPPVAAKSAAGADRNQVYTDQYQTAAMLNMQRSGVPASITLAQGILESGAGTSELAKNANNHFGVKCGNNWTGKTYMKKDDDRDEKGNLKESCFRKYEKVEESYMDHAQFLRDPKKDQRYGFLFKLDPTDYKGWAQGLQSSGYSTSNTYADKLIDIIERYQLYEYDVPGSSKASAVPEPVAAAGAAGAATTADIPLQTATNRVGKINNVKVVVAREGESISDIAKAYRLSPDKVAEYNDRGYTPIQKLKANTRVFINPKKDKWSGSTANEHVVKPNQTMFDISQLYGVKLNKLLERNVLSRGQEPAEGQRILLNSKRAATDEVQLRDESAIPVTTGAEPGVAPYTAPHSETLTPDQEGLLDEISGGETTASQSTPSSGTPSQPTVVPPPPTSSTSTPPTFTTPPQTTTSAPVPVVTGNTAYPPVSTSPTPEVQPELTKPPVAAPGTHIVVKGDTMTNIAKRYNISVAKLMQLNNMTDGNIKIGQTLKVK